MPSQLVATAGAINANSYATLEEIDSYMDDAFEDGGWSTFDEDTKIRFAFAATKMIDKLNIAYSRFSPDQSLKFPVRASGESEIPEGLREAKEACYMQILYMVSYSNQLDYATRAAITGITGESYSSETNMSRIPASNPYKRYAPGVHPTLSAYIDLSLKLSRG